jgi:hypothetical protein
MSDARKLRMWSIISGARGGILWTATNQPAYVTYDFAQANYKYASQVKCVDHGMYKDISSYYTFPVPI